MVQRVNNFLQIQQDLDLVLGFEDVKIQYDISIESDNRSISSRYGSAYMHVGGPTTELYLRYFINQLSVEQNAPNILTKIENKLTDMLFHVDGVYSQRVVEPFKDQATVTVYYTIKLDDYENFVTKLHRYARSTVDREFTEALEAKLSED